MKQSEVLSNLPELMQLEDLIKKFDFKYNQEALVTLKGHSLPIYSLEVRPFKKGLPTVIFTGGVHGIERIGSQILLSYLEMLGTKITWDCGLQRQLDSMNIIFIPIVNPGGMYLNTRANPNGVDLMRNAPIQAEIQPPLFGGGQRFSSLLPWYRGNYACGLEVESQVLLTVVERYTQQSPFTITIDCHSGFGLRDHLWFPYAYRKRPIAILDKLYALKCLLDNTHPNNDYVFEPQSLSYITHGDLWDYIYKRHKNENASTLLPLTLEMGSWVWVKKHPIQLLSFTGLFNPMVPHRHKRVLRRHLMLFDFMCSAAIAHKKWVPERNHRHRTFKIAKNIWYKGGSD